MISFPYYYFFGISTIFLKTCTCIYLENITLSSTKVPMIHLEIIKATFAKEMFFSIPNPFVKKHHQKQEQIRGKSPARETFTWLSEISHLRVMRTFFFYSGTKTNFIKMFLLCHFQRSQIQLKVLTPFLFIYIFYYLKKKLFAISLI